VTEHVDGYKPEMIGMRSEVSRIGFGMAADSVQRKD
jgi:hypothetical protein